MGTTHNFDNPAASAIASGDTLPLIDVTTGRGKTGTVAQLHGAAVAPVAAGGTLTLTQAAHAGKLIALDTAAGSVVTLPASTGGGAIYRFLITVTATSNSHVIKVGNATDEFRGIIIAEADTAAVPNFWVAADNDDTITFNRTTTGTAVQGHWVDIIDAVAGHFYVRGTIEQTGTEATPFSATVS